MPEEECELIKLFSENVEKFGNINFFLNQEKCKFLDENQKCRIYDRRPLDCRLFPLDIIEEDGEYYWCIYTVCPGYRKMDEIFTPSLISQVEKKITDSLWLQFKEQIRLTKDFYEPYKNKKYILIEKIDKFS